MVRIIETIAAIITPMQMLVINLFVINKCSERKFSKKVTYACMLLGVAALVPAIYKICLINPDFGNGNGLFVIGSFIFVFPVKTLYNISVSKIVSLACTSWVYTFIVFSVSVHIGYLIPDIHIGYSVLAVQTLIYTVTISGFYHMIRKSFLTILAQLTPQENTNLMWTSIFWFWTVFIVNLSFIYMEHIPLRIIALLSVSFCAFNFYRHIYRMLDSNRIIDRLKDVAYKDNLTQLRSRAVLSNDVDELLDRQVPFKLIFMDLNNFKSINDTYGHVAGDEYLAFFAREVKQRVGSKGGFYRISGDEFICIYTAPDILRFIDAISTLPENLPDSEMPFKGVSYGIAHYPDDGQTLSDLIHVADARMYAMKPYNKNGDS